jgi:uncharacterized protein YndB with AHSA1/START domain
MTDLGILEQTGDRWRLRFTRHLRQSPATVWRAISEPEHLEAWFPQRIVGAWSVGAPLTFASQYGDFDGEVLAYEPPALVEFRWGTDTIRLEVVGDGSEGSVLTLLDTFDEHGKAARDAAGWHACLDMLGDHLEQRPAAPAMDRWQAVHPRYVQSLGAEASRIGPPEGVGAG